MARTTISLPDDLKEEMDKLGGDTNWSSLAASAFVAELNRIKARKAALKGKPMNAAIQRLKESRERYLQDAESRGKVDGTRWAMESAEWGELKRLAEAWPRVESCETNDALGAPGVFLRMIHAMVDRAAIQNFWADFGKEHDDSDAYSSEYWDGFVVGALEVFEAAEE
jgi:hypothetical protein